MLSIYFTESYFKSFYMENSLINICIYFEQCICLMHINLFVLYYRYNKVKCIRIYGIIFTFCSIYLSLMVSFLMTLKNLHIVRNIFLNKITVHNIILECKFSLRLIYTIGQKKNNDTPMYFDV